MTTTETPRPDLAAVKQRQQQTWASGDYHAVAARIVLIAERLADAADRRAGDTVLDVATGSGNAALAAARCGCQVTGVDYVPELLERGRARAEAEGLEVKFQEVTPSAWRFPTLPSTRSCPAWGSCSLPTSGRRRPSWSGSAARAAPSPWPTGPRPASSARSSAPWSSTSRPRRDSSRRASGAPRSAWASCSARRCRGSRPGHASSCSGSALRTSFVVFFRDTYGPGPPDRLEEPLSLGQSLPR